MRCVVKWGNDVIGLTVADLIQIILLLGILFMLRRK